MTRRTAIVLLVAFVAGPAVNWECVWSCWNQPDQGRYVSAAETCHRSASDDAALTAADDSCGPDESRLSPFVKVTPITGTGPEILGLAPWCGVLSIVDTTTASSTIDVGPPGTRTRAPLRI